MSRRVGHWLTLTEIDLKMQALGSDLPDATLVDNIQIELAQHVLMRRQNMRFQRTVLRAYLVSETSDDDRVRDELLDLATRRDTLLEYRELAAVALLQILLAVIGKPIHAVLTARGWFRRKGWIRQFGVRLGVDCQIPAPRPGPVSGKQDRAAGGVS